MIFVNSEGRLDVGGDGVCRYVLEVWVSRQLRDADDPPSCDWLCHICTSHDIRADIPAVALVRSSLVMPNASEPDEKELSLFHIAEPLSIEQSHCESNISLLSLSSI